MAAFHKLEVYTITRSLVKDTYLLLQAPGYDHNLKDQLKRAATSIMLNIAEGTGRWGPKDKRRFFSIARGSALECMAVFDIIEDLELLTFEEAEVFRKRFGRVAGMLFGLIRHFDQVA